MSGIKYLLRERLENHLRFNNGILNKIGPNTIYMGDEPIIDFGIGKIGEIEIAGRKFNNSIFLQGGFNAAKQKQGYGRIGINFIFTKLPKIESLILQCYDTACPFWLKMGGVELEARDITKSGKPLRTLVITRENFNKIN
jgi:hypothetical protein